MKNFESIDKMYANSTKTNLANLLIYLEFQTTEINRYFKK